MNRPASTNGWTARTVGLLLLVGFLVVGLQAAAQDITVTSAIPEMADQGTLGLVVAISGDGFAKGSKVDFFVTGTTNPGGITVKSVKYKNPKALEATIDVAPDAQTQLKFDVQVMSGTRTGKGTELFKVIEKVTGGEIPPGSATNLLVNTGDNASILVSYTLPADDGYDPASGPVHSGVLSIRRGESPETPECGPHTVASATAELWEDPCHVREDWVPSGDPGSTATLGRPIYLAPSTRYYLMIRVWDTSSRGGRGLQSALEDDLAQQVSFTTGHSPITSWTSEVITACPPMTPYTSCNIVGANLDLDPAGAPVIRYQDIGTFSLASPGLNGWSDEPVWSGIDGRADGFALDPTGRPAMSRAYLSGSRWDVRFFTRTGATADAWQTEIVATGGVRSSASGLPPLAFNPVQGTPAIIYSYAKGSTSTLRIAEKSGAGWSSEDVASAPGSWIWAEHLVFHPDGNPAMTFRTDDGNGGRVAAFATRQNGAWHSEVVAGPTTVDAGWSIYGPVLAYDPHRGNFAAAFRTSLLPLVKVNYCERGPSGVWTCNSVPDCGAAGDRTYVISVAIGSDGTVHVAHVEDTALFVSTRTPPTPEAPTGAWTREYVGWGITDVSDLKVSPDGSLVIAFSKDHDETGMGSTSSVVFARRPLTP